MISSSCHSHADLKLFPLNLHKCPPIGSCSFWQYRCKGNAYTPIPPFGTASNSQF
jgi:hypothetical protein